MATGKVTLSEYQSGTSPTNAVSLLKLETVTQANGRATMSFNAASNHTYTVEWCVQPAGGSWLKLADVLARSINRIEGVADGNASDPGPFLPRAHPRQP